MHAPTACLTRWTTMTTMDNDRPCLFDGGCRRSSSVSPSDGTGICRRRTGSDGSWQAGVRTRGRSSKAEGNYAAALSLLWEASGLAPRDAEVQNRLGEALERIGALDAAVDAYRRALAERPAFRKASNNLILALVKTGKGPEAVERARALVARVARRSGSLLHARTRAIRTGHRGRDPDLPQGCSSSRHGIPWRATTWRSCSGARIGCRRRSPSSSARSRSSRGRKPHYTMGIIYWHQGELDRAATALRAAVAAEPKYADAHDALG